jgi:hypothetical protein
MLSSGASSRALLHQPISVQALVPPWPRARGNSSAELRPARMRTKHKLVASRRGGTTVLRLIESAGRSYRRLVLAPHVEPRRRAGPYRDDERETAVSGIQSSGAEIPRRILARSPDDLRHCGCTVRHLFRSMHGNETAASVTFRVIDSFIYPISQIFIFCLFKKRE